MARTEFFSGLSQGGVRVIDQRLTTGNVFFVKSGHASGGDTSGYGSSPDRPFLTLAFAISQCTASNGDMIYLLPGHAESLSAAGAIAASVAGITIVGLGNGSNRPTFTWANTAATFDVSAANVTIRNIRCTVSTDEVVKLFSITAANCMLDAVDFFETASAQAIQFALTNASATDLVIKNCVHRQATAANSAQVWVQLVGADRARILDNAFFLTLNNAAGSSVLASVTTAPVDIEIAGNVIVQLGGTTQTKAIALVANTTGCVHDNRVAADVTTLAGTVALASCYGAENYVSHTVNKCGILDPVADA
jgi:hypothetical protein